MGSAAPKLEYVMNLKDKFETAKKAHEMTMGALERASQAYAAVEPAYAELKRKLDELAQSKREQIDIMAAAKERLAAAMLTTMGRMSDEVKEALAARRNADDLVDQFDDLVSIVNEQVPGVHIQISAAARTYLQAYENAVATWAEKNALGVLVDCGDRLAQAMSVQSNCRRVVLRELDYLCDNYKDGLSPYKELIPAPQLGALPVAEILSPASISQMKSNMADA
jgi:chromosome segregation ATPase